MHRPEMHPTLEQLQAFGAGTLPDHEEQKLLSHLEACEYCRQTLSHFARDPFETLVLAATKEIGLAPTLQPHERLDRYRILRVIDRGGMATVYEAHDEQLQRTVALKVMKPELAAVPHAKERFFREARTAAGLEHEHIVPIYHVGEDRRLPFLVMPLLKGQTLARVLDARIDLSLETIVAIGQQIADGLGAAHQHGLIHRDIKPANIFLVGGLESTPQVVILDFGLALPTLEDTDLTQSGLVLGTPAYMAPEQARGEAVDARSDLFSLGVVLYRLLTKQLPFQGTTTMEILTALAVNCPEPPRRLMRRVPKRLSDLVMRLLDKSPAGRPKDAGTVHRLLGEALRPERRRLLPAMFTVMLAGLLVAGIIPFLKQPAVSTPESPPKNESSSPARADDRDIASHALRLGAVIELESPEGLHRLVRADAELPHEACRLRTVDFNRNVNMSDELLTFLKDTQHLRVAILSNIPITNATVAHLKNNSELTELRLHATKVTDAVYEHLRPLVGLRHLRIDQTSLGEATVALLSRDLPYCTIIWNGGVRPASMAEAPTATLDGHNYALHYDELGEGASFPALALPETGPLTMESYMMLPTHDYRADRVILGCRYQFQLTNMQSGVLGLFGKNHMPDERLVLNKIYTQAAMAERLQPDRMYHVACVRTSDEFRLYVDGKCVGKSPSTTLPPGFFQLAARTRGTFDEVRVSDTVRYTSDFVPSRVFTPDEHTLALFHCDEGAGTIIADASRHARHARIGNGQWKRLETTGK